MANRGTFHLVDLVLDGELADTLRRWSHDEDLSNYEIAQRLRDEHGVSVSAETVRRWVNELEPVSESEAS